MNEISVVIPTMWKSKQLEILLNNLNNCDRIGEILIIDNDHISKNVNIDNYNKVVYLKMEQNIYVNPSWNLGVLKSNFDIVALLNDDILFDVSFFDQLSVSDETLIGVAEQSYRDRNDLNFRLEETDNRNWGFGCMIIFNKKYYVQIPGELKIWFGDDYLFKRFKNKLVIKGVFIDTNMSTTSDIKSFDDIKNKDEIIYNSKYKN
jgi:hypothetical protein